jgi:POT family proton-dependent oligopeptide transporter
VTARLPRQIPFIIGNEGCERFSFYGMRNILTPFLVNTLLIHIAAPDARDAAAKDVFHTFVMGVYFFPLIGGYVADRWVGNYRTIFWLSLLYCAGHACLAIFESNRPGFYTGLFLIALGSGGIKPCVSAFVGDQFDQTNKHLAKVVYDAFYWIINFGSFFASLLMPIVLRESGPAVAFAIPGVLMFLATIILWVGRSDYVMVPPRPKDPHSFASVVRTALVSEKPGEGRPGLVVFFAGVALSLAAFATLPSLGATKAICLSLVAFITATAVATHLQIERARGKHPDEDVDGAKAVLRVLVVFALVTPFWSLFDQKASTWILQARAMNLPEWAWFRDAAQMQALNPLLVMLLIPFNNLVAYPALRKIGIEPTPLRRMTAGMVLAGLSWIVVGAFQLSIDGGERFTILWQILPYALLTLGEVLVSATGLEFAYSQAPTKMKGVIMSFWMLAVTVGNLWVLLVNAGIQNDAAIEAVKRTGLSSMAFSMFFFAGFAFVTALAFGAVAMRYKVSDYYRA